MTQPETANNKLRIDKWLWAARFFKTRSLAIDAIEMGKVLCNDTRVKPAKALATGDQLTIRFGKFQFDIEVVALSDKRGPAPQAQKLYRESDDSKAKRAALAAEAKAQPAQTILKGRPTKRDRRDIETLKTGAW
jgi:ribosome-associated heat shock protein Hsp15